MCLFVLCVGLIYLTGDVTAQKAFHPGVIIKINGEPLNVKTGHSVPTVADWNNDGKKDLITGQFHQGRILLLLNRGTDANPVFTNYKLMEAGGSQIKLPAG